MSAKKRPSRRKVQCGHFSTYWCHVVADVSEFHRYCHNCRETVEVRSASLGTPTTHGGWKDPMPPRGPRLVRA